MPQLICGFLASLWLSRISLSEATGARHDCLIKNGSRSPFGILDIGSSKLACLIAQRSSANGILLLGQAMHAAEGVKQGEITDMNKFSTSVGKTVSAAERNSNISISTIHIVTPGGNPAVTKNVQSIDIHNHVISRRDIQRLLHADSNQNLPVGHVRIQNQRGLYQLDDKSRLKTRLACVDGNSAFNFHSCLSLRPVMRILLRLSSNAILNWVPSITAQ